MTQRRGERGSALLIVFVLAAIVAIALYMEMPVAVFEAKREKEQLLIDRGNEYARGVKLFMRKFHTYPATIAQLEDTNRLRFLRHKFNDPFTGKDDWRQLHAGPGGMLIDSKVNPITNNANGTASGYTGSTPIGGNANNTSGSAFGNGNSFGSNSGGSFGNGNSFGSGFSSNSSSSSGDQVVVAALPTRAPAVAANGGPENPSGTAEASQNPGASLLPAGQAEQAINGAGTGSAVGAPVAQAGPNTGSEASPIGGQANGQANGGVGAGANPNSSGGPNGNSNAMQMVRNLLSTPAMPSTGTSSFNSGSNSQVMSGGFAGVASKAKGKSIKSVNDQTDYSLWEFFYDPTKDKQQIMPGAQAGTTPGMGNGVGAGVGNGMGGLNNGTAGANTGSFGQSSSFGQGSGFGQSSGFGQGSGNQNSSGGFNQNQNGFGQNSGTPNPGNGGMNPGAANPPSNNPPQ